jgi:hypothetical protein
MLWKQWICLWEWCVGRLQLVIEDNILENQWFVCNHKKHSWQTKCETLIDYCLKFILWELGGMKGFGYQLNFFEKS